MWLEEVRETLLARRRALLSKVAQVESDLRWLDENLEPEIEEEGQEANLARLLERLGEQEREEIEQIDRALTRIEAGDYGFCEACGERIPPARLRALPTAVLCVCCTEEREGRTRG